MPKPLDADPAPLPTAPFSMPPDPADETRLVQLAFTIANQAVICDIESYCVKHQLDGRVWWDTRPMVDPREHAPEAMDMATQAIQYAVGAGLVAVHPQRPYLITIQSRG